MDAIPNTLNYMIGGYIVFAVVMVAYVASLISRWKNLQSEQRMLEEVDTK
jgi:hypothetical protein